MLKDEVHVWRIPLLADASRVAACDELLSAAEQDRASRFRHERDRDAFILAHGSMRMILARYARRAPEELTFVEGPHGKPALRPASLEFNLSHAGGLGLLAVSTHGPVGIDVARHDAKADHAGIAGRFFSPAEQTALDALRGDPVRLMEAFHAAWTRKEAYVKATGFGLTRGLDHFDVTVEPRDPPCLIADRLDPHAATRWSLSTVDVGPGYSAAVVTAKTAGGLVLLDASDMASRPDNITKPPA
jgi:4'-phosphopantetheinyl transferase